jgi:hypothetical protein
VTVQQLRKELQELKEEAAKPPNLWMCDRLQDEIKALKVKEEILKDNGELKAKIQHYDDMGVFDEADSTVNMNWGNDNIPTLTTHLIQRWKNRHNLTIKEKIQLYRDIGFFVQE